MITRRVVEPRESFLKFICFISFNHDSVFNCPVFQNFFKFAISIRERGRSYFDILDSPTETLQLGPHSSLKN